MGPTTNIGGNTGAPSREVAGREVHHSPPSRAEFQNAWSYTSTISRLILDSYLTKQILRGEQQKALLIIFADKVKAFIYLSPCARVCRAR
jgi:hypothetical protein